MTASMRDMRGDNVEVAREVAAGLANTAAFPTDGKGGMQAFSYGVSSKLLTIVSTRRYSRNVRDFASCRVQNSFIEATEGTCPVAGWLFSMRVF